MQKTYWTLFSLCLMGIILSFVFCIFIIILFGKKRLNLKYFVVSILTLLLVFFVSIYRFGYCIKDYNFAKNNTFMEETLTVIEFTNVERDLDGNGRISYSEPKFYIHGKDEYIVLYTQDVEIGKTYRVRYYPNTKICEILYCIE